MIIDLYGEDDNEFVVPLQEAEDEPEETRQEAPPEIKAEDKSATKSEASSAHASPTSASKIDAHSLPAKPGLTSTSADQMSYSAQIARQFSAYHQTPSQERQQRTEIPLPANPNAHTTQPSAGTSAIATHETSANRANPDRPIRPSEMKDEG
jgi:RNA-binding protein Musashi